jgi:hypothetical protein
VPKSTPIILLKGGPRITPGTYVRANDFSFVVNGRRPSQSPLLKLDPNRMLILDLGFLVELLTSGRVLEHFRQPAEKSPACVQGDVGSSV